MRSSARFHGIRAVGQRLVFGNYAPPSHGKAPAGGAPVHRGLERATSRCVRRRVKLAPTPQSRGQLKSAAERRVT